ncbi:MAG: glutathione S-transferase family protein [Proteobacteria bacterium]|nr:glutathione S-transferase family protein [Pseudomonadota bacterium]
MILIGQYDSPFVRRVGIAMTLYGLAFEHRPWSAFSDAFRIRQFNPLIRVPTLVLDSGEALIDSHAILDYLDGLADEGRQLLPASNPERYRARRVTSLAAGLGDKAVSLFYERTMHKAASDIWVERLKAQIDGALTVLDIERSTIATDYWFGSRISHADITVGAVWRYINDAHPGLVTAEDFPTLAAMCERLETLPAFRQISQPLIAPV